MKTSSAKPRFCPACKNPVDERNNTCVECMTARGPDGWPEDPHCGTVLCERYRIDRRIGADGTGLTFLGTTTADGPRVVIRVLDPKLARTPGLVEGFLAEMGKVRGLTHPAFPAILEVGKGLGPDLPACFVREFVEGESLARLLSRDLAFDVPETLAIATRIAQGMKEAHDRGIVHRHLRPDKIVFRGLSDPEPVKILDLGFSSVAPLEEVTSMGHVDALRYCPPEGARQVNPRIDVFALGVLIFDMVSGLPEFRSSIHGSGVAPERLSMHRPTLSKALDDLVYTMMAGDPADRPAGMKDVLAAIGKIGKGGPPKAEAPGPWLPKAAPTASKAMGGPGPVNTGKTGRRIIGGSAQVRKPAPTPSLKMLPRQKQDTGRHGMFGDELSRPTLSPPAPEGGKTPPAKPVFDRVEEISALELFQEGAEPLLPTAGPGGNGSEDLLADLPSLPPLVVASTPEPPQGRSRRKGRVVVAILSCAVLAIAAGAMAWYLTGGLGPDATKAGTEAGIEPASDAPAQSTGAGSSRHEPPAGSAAEGGAADPKTSHHDPSTAVPTAVDPPEAARADETADPKPKDGNADHKGEKKTKKHKPQGDEEQDPGASKKTGKEAEEEEWEMLFTGK